MRKSLLNLSIVMMTVMLLSCTPEKGGRRRGPGIDRTVHCRAQRGGCRGDDHS